MHKVRHKLFGIGFVVIAFLFYFLDPATHRLFPKCILYSVSGIYCPGCGSQRALHCLLHFDWAGVVRYNILFFPAAFILLYHYIHPVLNRWMHWKLPNILYHKNTPWIVLAVVVAFWIGRNLPPFSVLAPG